METVKFSYFLLLSVFFLLWLSALVGLLVKKRHPLPKTNEKDLSLLAGATLTLLALLIGFSFSMATTRFDARKKSEARETNAIETAFLRATLLPESDSNKLRQELSRYTQLRLDFYSAQEHEFLHELKAKTKASEALLWSTVSAPAMANPTNISGLIVSSINEVINAENYTQAMWWYRVPIESWILLIVIACFGNVLVGYSTHDIKWRSVILLILPLVVTIAVTLIADIDSPRGGMISIEPDNLSKLSELMNRVQ